MLFTHIDVDKAFREVHELLKKDWDEQTVVDKIRMLFRADNAGFYIWQRNLDAPHEEYGGLWADSPRDFIKGRSDGGRLAGSRLPRDGALAGALKKGEVTFIPNVDDSAIKVYKAVNESCSELDVPVLFKGRKVGGFFLSWNKHIRRSNELVGLAERLMPMVGFAFGERLAEDVQVDLRAQTRRAVAAEDSSRRRSDFIAAILSYTGTDFHEFCRLLFEEFHKMLPCKFLAYWSYSWEEELLVAMATGAPGNHRFELPTNFEDIINPASSLIGLSLPGKDSPGQAAIKAWKLEGRTWTNQLGQEEVRSMGVSANKGLLAMLGAHTFIPLPLTTADVPARFLGFLCAHVDDIRGFEKRHLEALALAVGRALNLLIERTRRKTRDRLFTEIFPKIVDFEGRPAAWSAMARFIADVAECEACSIFLLDPPTKRLMLRGSTGICRDPQKRDGERLPEVDYDRVYYEFNAELRRYEGATGYCFSVNRPALGFDVNAGRLAGSARVRQLHKHVERLPDGRPSRSLLFVPVREVGASPGQPPPPAQGVIRCVNKKSPQAQPGYKAFARPPRETRSACSRPSPQLSLSRIPP